MEAHARTVFAESDGNGQADIAELDLADMATLGHAENLKQRNMEGTKGGVNY
jgi:hypothetical protein